MVVTGACIASGICDVMVGLIVAGEGVDCGVSIVLGVVHPVITITAMIRKTRRYFIFLPFQLSDNIVSGKTNRVLVKGEIPRMTKQYDYGIVKLSK
jgi:hypothetical protein